MNASQRAYLTVAVAVLSISLPLNLVVLFANVFHLRKLAPSSVLIFSLCLSDALCIGNVLVVCATNLSTSSLNYDKAACQIHGLFTTFSALMSLFIVSGLTLFRYLVIVKQVRLKPLFAVQYLLVAAVLSGITAMLPYVYNMASVLYVLEPSGLHCGVAWYSRDPRNMAIAIASSVGVAGAVAGILYAYLRIYQKAAYTFREYKHTFVLSDHELQQHQQHQQRQQPGTSKNTQIPSVPLKSNAMAEASSTPLEQPWNGPNEPVLPTAAMDFEEEQKQKLLLVQSIAIVCVFGFGWTPYMSWVVVQVWMGEPTSQVFEVVSGFCVLLNVLLNPVVAVAFDAEIRSNLLQLFCWSS
ncbi:hypothetical protein BJ741DRAFT_585898 [Chytriomyces cf. hyalinus JEL632]|nr:hypothetical protein BJ741DRAFT_585898 [Chytriomyces cf. hyalinus JEL632]